MIEISLIQAMNTIAPTLSFHDHILFDVYRQQLEHVSNLGTTAVTTPKQQITTPVVVTQSPKKAYVLKPEDETMMIDEMEPDILIDHERGLKEKQERHVAWLEQQQKEQQQLQNKQDLYTKEYAMLKQLETLEKGKGSVLYDYTTEDIIETAAARCDWLLENDIKVENMNHTNALLRRNLEFEMMCQDKRCAKIVALHDKFIDVALTDGVSTSEFDYLVAKTHRIAQDPENDQLLHRCAEPKKRGRTSDADRMKTLNIIDTLRREFITPKKVTSGEPLTTTSLEMALEASQNEKYKTFMALLKMIHENALTKDNCGSYIEKMIRLVNTEKEVDWPMKSLMKSILNMETCIGINEIESIVIDEGEGPYYCSYSGDCIKTGDNVYHIRILEYSHERHKKWRILKNKPNREFEAPEFMDSVRAFFVKKHHTSLTGLWFRDLDENYKAHHANTATTVASPPTKRAKHERKPRVVTKQDGHLWRRMDYMRNYINQHNLEHKEVKGRSFAKETKRIHAILTSINDEHTLQSGLFDIIGPYINTTMDDETRMTSLNRLMYVILDLIDLFYSVNACEDGTHRPLTERDSPNCVLRLLLDLVHQRRNHPSYSVISNEFEKIDREAGDINTYIEFSDNNFLFLALFDYLFPTTIIKKESEAIEVLHMFGL